jgi:hypothetical protein
MVISMVIVCIFIHNYLCKYTIKFNLTTFQYKIYILFQYYEINRDLYE